VTTKGRIAAILARGGWHTARQLATRLGVGSSTVANSALVLCREGAAQRRKNSAGSFEYSKPDAATTPSPTVTRYGTPEEVMAAFTKAGYTCRQEGPSTVRVTFKGKGSEKLASWWFSCRTGRWKRNNSWSSEFGAKGLDACLAALAKEAA